MSLHDVRESFFLGRLLDPRGFARAGVYRTAAGATETLLAIVVQAETSGEVNRQTETVWVTVCRTPGQVYDGRTVGGVATPSVGDSFTLSDGGGEFTFSGNVSNVTPYSHRLEMRRRKPTGVGRQFA